MNGGLARKYFGLSRMSHSVLDVPYLAIGAILTLGGIPPTRTIVLGLLSAFAGITAIFGLNDVMDRRVDAQKMAAGGGAGPGTTSQFDLDSLGHRHPLAQGKLSLGASLAWVIFWGALSFAAAFMVRPVCAWLLLAAAGFEVEYCALLRVTPWKTVFTGLNVAVGGLAAPYAVQAAPSPAFILLYFVWAFTWEVGCRNIPNDWTDLEDDVSLGIRTIPVRFGRTAGARVSCAVTAVTVLCSFLFPLASPLRLWPVYELGALAAAMYFLILPSLAWRRALDRQSAMTFFNRACLYPLALFVIIVTLALV